MRNKEHSLELNYDASIMDLMFDVQDAMYTFQGRSELERRMLNRIINLADPRDAKGRPRPGILSDMERKVFVLAYIEECLSKSEIAKKLGISMFTVNTHLRRSKDKLMKILNEDVNQIELSIIDQSGSVITEEDTQEDEDDFKHQIQETFFNR